MDAKTKKYLLIGGGLVLAYLLYKKYGNKMGLPMSKGSGTNSFVADEQTFHQSTFND